jgi:hypothetical protein
MKVNITQINKENVFKVPVGYFEKLIDSIEKRIESQEITLKTPANQPDFGVPEGYFENLSDKIFAKISANQKQKISIENLPKSNVFRVPEGYFDTDILLKKSTQKETKIIKVRWWNHKKLLWSAAASVVLLATSIWLLLPKQSETDLALDEINQKEIVAYLETQDLSLIESVEMVNDSTQSADYQLLENLNLENKDIIQALKSEGIEDI